MEKKLVPFFVYLTQEQASALRETGNVSKSIRKAVQEMLGRDSTYEDGFRSGVNRAAECAERSRHGSMRYPHGKTVGESIAEEIKSLE